MIERSDYSTRLARALCRSPVTALLGPRQCGKTTLARAIAAQQPSHFFDLESPRDQLRLHNPELALSELSGLVVLDEVQTRPDLFPLLRVLSDRPDRPATFLLLGSASPSLIKESSESLAGRIEFIDLHGFDLAEVGWDQWRRAWVRGGFPRSYLADTDDDSEAWREGFIRTFLERDLPQFGVGVPAPTMRRFWTMLAHLHGQTWNAAELARSMGVKEKVVRGYLDTLTQTYMIRQVQPWFENLGKRQVKSPKIYLRDSGVLHSLLSVTADSALQSHPKVGASWEGYALEQTLRVLRSPDAYFWGTHGGAELDLVVTLAGRRYGFEFKFSETPSTTRSMWTSLEALRLDHLWIVCPGAEVSPIRDNVSICGIVRLGEVVARLLGADR